MRNITMQEFRQLLEKNGSSDAFNKRIREIAMRYPAAGRRSVIYPSVYDMSHINLYLKMDVEIVFEGRKRISVLHNIEEIDIDQYINLSTQSNAEFRTVYAKMLEYIYR